MYTVHFPGKSLIQGDLHTLPSHHQTPTLLSRLRAEAVQGKGFPDSNDKGSTARNQTCNVMLQIPTVNPKEFRSAALQYQSPTSRAPRLNAEAGGVFWMRPLLHPLRPGAEDSTSRRRGSSGTQTCGWQGSQESKHGEGGRGGGRLTLPVRARGEGPPRTAW